MGRPTVTLTLEQVREVETLAALLNHDQIADYLGISQNTFRAIRQRAAEVAACYKRGKAKAIAHVANGLLQKARAGDTTCAIFYLKTQAGWRETVPVEDIQPEQQSSARERLKAFLDGINTPDRLEGLAHGNDKATVLLASPQTEDGA